MKPTSFWFSNSIERRGIPAGSNSERVLPPISNSPVYQTLSLPDQAERADLRIAFVHEWFTTYAGSEKVLEVMVSEFPDADLFSLIDRLNPQQRGGLSGRKVTTTFLNRIPFVQK